jgi:hypothetical protein
MMLKRREWLGLEIRIRPPLQEKRDDGIFPIGASIVERG